MTCDVTLIYCRRNVSRINIFLTRFHINISRKIFQIKFYVKEHKGISSYIAHYAFEVS